MSSTSSTVTTNELKLYDFKGAKTSLTFGDADINDGYSYLRINFRANDNKFDFYQDKPIFNIIADKEITFNDKKIWSELNHGPMSGLNADLLDGLHASEFKDRMGHHHFNHAFIPGGDRMFVKIATLTPRRVGNAPDFNTNGTPPFQGKFADNIVKRMEVHSKFEAFIEDTPDILDSSGISGFEHTDMATEGVYNATLRASVSLLRKGDTKKPPWSGPETLDIHIGIFEDPTNSDTDGWSCTSKYFYVSLHDRNIPFIKEPDDPDHDYLIGNNVSPVPRTKINRKKEILQAKSRATSAQEDHEHSRPSVEWSDYATPPDYSKNDYMSEVFPNTIPPGFSYQKYLEGLRLYHVDSHVDTIDGVQIVTHKFDLYIVVDSKMELHVQPYMSSSCLLYNYQKPISESDLPDGNYLRPYSMYDNRYSHVEHRHRTYEQKIEDMDVEIEEVWNCFDNYVSIDQGRDNSNKMLMTQETGKVVAVKDNFERHRDNRRSGKRVLVTDSTCCIAESSITTKELAQLDNIRDNVQDQFDELKSELDKMPDGDNFVKKSGDTMTGWLRMKNGSEIAIYGVEDENSTKKRMHIHTKNGYSGFHDAYENLPICGLFNDTTDTNERIFFVQKKVIQFGGIQGSNTSARLYIDSIAPSNPRNGDVWIKNI